MGDGRLAMDLRRVTAFFLYNKNTGFAALQKYGDFVAV